MRILKSLIALFLGCTAAFGATDRLTAEWQTRYDRLSATIVGRNVKAFQDYLSDDYVWVQPNGTKMNRKEAIAAFAPLFQMKKISGGEKVKKVERKGDTVEVTYDAKWKLVAKNGKVSHDVEQGVDTWRKVGANWKVVKTVDIVSKMK